MCRLYKGSRYYDEVKSDCKSNGILYCGVVYYITSFPRRLLIRLFNLFGVGSILGYGITRRSSDRYKKFGGDGAMEMRLCYITGPRLL